MSEFGISVGVLRRGCGDDRQRECENEHRTYKVHSYYGGGTGLDGQTESVVPMAYFSQAGLRKPQNTK